MRNEVSETTYSNNLEFSDNRGLTKQQILFNESDFIYHKNKENILIPDSYYSNGYILINNIPNINEASNFLQQFTASLDTNKIPIYSRLLPKIQLAKIDRIPACAELMQKGYQALHFDMGQPFLSQSTQTMYLITALYCPSDGISLSAKTRVVSIKKLLAQKIWGNKDVIENRLIDYVKKYGDGWKKPDVVNTFRLACFARFIDAISGTTILKNLIDTPIDNLLGIGIQDEYNFYSTYGLDLKKVEEQICLGPNQLLIIDNIRAIHGRIGNRKLGEIYQLMLGIRSATPEDIDAFRKYFISEIL